MATWEPKMPSLHHDAGLWSIKSSSNNPPDSWASTAAAAAPELSNSLPSTDMSQPPQLLPRSLIDALSTRNHFANSSSGSSLEPGVTSGHTPSELLPKSQREFHEATHHRTSEEQQSGSSLGLVGSVNATEPCKSEPVDSHSAASTKSPSAKLLSGPASLGGGSTKVAKKRARASRKPPTTILEADTANFRAMVQQLTGIPAVPFLPSSAGVRSGLEFLNLVKPSARSYLGGQGLPPLSSSSFPFSSSSPLSRGQRPVHPEPGFPAPYSKGLFMGSDDHGRQATIGDFLRTPMQDLGQELGLDRNSSLLDSMDEQQQQQQQEREFPETLRVSCNSIPLLWEGEAREADDLRGLQLDSLTKFKVGKPNAGDRPEPEETEDGSSRLAIVDSWLTHADHNTENRSVN